MITKACEMPKATDSEKVDRIKRLADAQKARKRQNKTFHSDKKSSRRNHD
jgi:formiminotetrahydrofolate cyclodeaminase